MLTLDSLPSATKRPRRVALEDAGWLPVAPCELVGGEQTWLDAGKQVGSAMWNRSGRGPRKCRA